MYWKLNPDILPEECQFEQIDSTSGDKCHHNIKNLSDTKARQIIKHLDASEVKVCTNGSAVSFSAELHFY